MTEDNPGWGYDMSKWLIRKSRLSNDWFAFPPGSENPVVVPTFEAALAIVRG